MTEDEDLDGLAAEYVLGSLDVAERREVNARRRREPALDRAVTDWERRLAPLAEASPEVAPPPDLFSRISDRLWGESAGAAVIPLSGRSRSGGLRVSTLAGLGLAACLLLGVAWVLLNGATSPTLLVAELHRSPGAAADEGTGASGSPAIKVAVDLKARSVTVTPLSIRAAPKRSFQLWLLRSGQAPPVSLGLISYSAPTRVPWRDDFPTSGLVDDSLAVSLEPEGGSPARTPTGPILYVGKLAPARVP